MKYEPIIQLGTLFEHALFLLVTISLPFMVVVVVGALIVGVVRVATQIDDLSIGLLGRVSGAFFFLYFAFSYYGPRIVGFFSRVWGGSDYYF